MPLLPSTHLPTCPPACHPPQVKADLLLDQAAVEAALRQAGASATGVTHIFHCAYIMRQEAAEECGVNLSMLRNVVEGAEAAGCRLQHVFCMQGTKWYGQASRWWWLVCCCGWLVAGGRMCAVWVSRIVDEI